VSKYAAANVKGNMADLMRVKESLPAQLRKYVRLGYSGNTWRT
jgi:hypothetical protein